MSDEDDDRMDRAKRIRRMREGQRSDDGDDGADEPDEGDQQTVDDGPADEDTATDDTASTEAATEVGSDEPDTENSRSVNDERSDDADETDAEASPADETDPGSSEASGEADTNDEAAPTARPTQTVEHSTAAADGASQPTRADGAAETDTTEEDPMSEHTSTSETEASTVADNQDPEAVAQRAAQAAASLSSGSTETETAPSTGGGATPAETAAAIQDASGGVDLPDQEQIEAALEAADESVETEAETPAEAGPGPAAAESETTTEESTRVLEFTLGAEHYCIDISLVEEIVKRDTITRVPNTDDYIEGVVDLRGQITTILNPKELLDIDAEGSETLMIVFDPEAFDDQGAIGWIVDEVRQVAPIRESEVNEPPVREEYIHGVVDREDGFVIWTKPEVAIALATADEADDE